MSFEMMTDREVVAKLGKCFDKVRRHKHIQDKTVLEFSGTSSAVLAKFRGGKGNITLESFVKLMRGIGELEQLENLLQVSEQFSPTRKPKALPKRIHKPNKPAGTFKWGDET